MKKERSLTSALLVGLFVALLILAPNVSAQDPLEGTIDKIEDTQGKVDEGIEKITDTPENIRDRYLTKSWGEMIGKSKVLGPFHRFFSKYPLPFIIVFNYPYEISLTFFCIVFLWLYLVMMISKQASSFELMGEAAPLFLGIFTAIILAQSGLIKLIVTSTLALILSNEFWLFRLIMGAIVIAFILVLGYINNRLGNALKARREASKRARQEQIIKKAESIMKGVEEGQELADEVKIIRSRGSKKWKKAA